MNYTTYHKEEQEMSAINEMKQKGNAYRVCIDDSDPTDLKWARQSFWTAASDVEFEDGKTAEQKLDELNANMQEKFNLLFQSASDGKSLIASTLTGLGVNTALDATYQTMSDNIKILATNKYNEGYSAGYSIGYQEGSFQGYRVIEMNNVQCHKKHYLSDLILGESGQSGSGLFSVPYQYMLDDIPNIKQDKVAYIFQDGRTDGMFTDLRLKNDAKGLYLELGWESAISGEAGIHGDPNYGEGVGHRQGRIVMIYQH